MYNDFAVTLVLAFDFSNDPFVSPITIASGTTLANPTLGLHQTTKVPASLDGLNWTATGLYVESADTPVVVTETNEIQVTVNGYFTGTVTDPGGNQYS
jgi:hypothetical protein